MCRPPRARGQRPRAGEGVRGGVAPAPTWARLRARPRPEGIRLSRRGRPVPETLGRIASESLWFDDAPLDLEVYFAAALRLNRDRYCFLNSFSEPLVDGWLAKLDAARAERGVGLVGATGSWASNRSWVLYNLLLPSPYRGVFPGRAVARRLFREIDHEARARGRETASASTPATSTMWQLARDRLRVLPRLPGQVLAYDAFPAPHLRTNAFMMSRDILQRLDVGTVRRKDQAYRLESGHHSLTRQVLGLGERVVVVDRDGVCYDCERWDVSRTLWQGDQEGLLVADNQTRSYANGDLPRRQLLAGFAWGRHAKPRARTGGDSPGAP